MPLSSVQDFIQMLKDRFGEIPDWALPIIAQMIPQSTTAADMVQQYDPQYYNEDLSPAGQSLLQTVPFRQGVGPLLTQAPSRLLGGIGNVLRGQPWGSENNLLADAGAYVSPEPDFGYVPWDESPFITGSPMMVADPRSLIPREGEFASVNQFLQAYDLPLDLARNNPGLAQMAFGVYNDVTRDNSSAQLARHEAGHLLEPPINILQTAYEGLTAAQQAAFAESYNNLFNYSQNPAREAYGVSSQFGMGQSPLAQVAADTGFFTPQGTSPGALPVLAPKKILNIARQRQRYPSRYGPGRRN